MPARTPVWPFWFAACLTYGLIILGGTVTGSQSGLGCGAHWPVCHGQLLPAANIHSVIEWSHRALAAIVGLVVAVMAVWTFYRTRDSRLRYLAVAAVALLLVQVALGAVIVLTRLPALVVAFHDATATLLLAVLMTQALVATRLGRPLGRGGASQLLWTAAAAALVAVFLGSYLAHLNLSASGFLNGIRVLGTDQGRLAVGPGWWHWMAAGLVLVLAAFSMRSYRTMPASARRWVSLAWLALGLQASLGLVLLATELDGLALVAHEALGVATVVFFVAAAVRASTDAATPSRIPRMGS